MLDNRFHKSGKWNRLFPYNIRRRPGRRDKAGATRPENVSYRFADSATLTNYH
jgi:hypothetical protein